ncbi:hypothetical protein Micbo1qcDRAFT_56526 [Microdochium bolleyi]|uniref:Uncharacterized protein n=1 Tax=Microdochium bolleyi TaxID=196109 RepID=A0A136IKR6_9PEZI|nr:hypothetical protein Micbo1qcDRAFT_56526 [Microdochium bolleyi]
MFSSTYEWMFHMARHHCEFEWICMRCSKRGAAISFQQDTHLREHLSLAHHDVELLISILSSTPEARGRNRTGLLPSLSNRSRVTRRVRRKQGRNRQPGLRLRTLAFAWRGACWTYPARK